MKRNILLFTLLFAFLLTGAQTYQVKLTGVKLKKIWPAVEYALLLKNIAVSNYNQSSGIAVTDFFEYNLNLKKNRAKLKLTVVDSLLAIEISEIQVNDGNVWVAAAANIYQLSQDSLLKPLINNISLIFKTRDMLSKAIKISKLIPESEKLETEKEMFIPRTFEATNGDLSVRIETSGYIGNSFFISGKFVATSDISPSINYAKIISPDGNVYDMNMFSLAGNMQNLAVGVYPNMIADLPMNFEIYFDTKGKIYSSVTKLTILWAKDRYSGYDSLNLYELPVPFGTDTNLTSGTFQVYKNCYIKWLKSEETPDGLKLHYVLINNSGKDIHPDYNHYLSIYDKSGNVFYRVEAFLNNSPCGYSSLIKAYESLPGYFLIQDNIKAGDISVLIFSSEETTYKVKEFYTGE